MNELVQALSEKFNLPVDAVWADFETILQRFIKYETIQSFVVAAIFLIFAAIGFYVLKNLVSDYKKCKNSKIDTTCFEYEYGSVWMTVEGAFAFVFMVVSLILGLIVGIVELMAGIKWILIPEIQTIQWLGR